MKKLFVTYCCGNKIDKIVEKRGKSYTKSDFLREIVKDAVK